MKQLLLVLALVMGCTPQAQSAEGQPLPQKPPPVVYEGLEFPELPYSSNFVEVSPEGYPAAKMHFMDTGNAEGGTMLLLHGQPTWSYLWRNVIPGLEPHARVIAVDLIGMGMSDKPDINYTFVDHAAYIESFVETLGLEDVTLVIHDWGSALGFDYAYRHQDNVKGIAFMEALIAPIPSLEAIEATAPEFAEALEVFRDPVLGPDALINQNVFIEQLLPQLTVATLSEEIMNAYRVPYPTPETRTPVYRWPNEIPVAGKPAATFERISAYAPWLFETEIPKLQLWASPGLIGNAEFAAMVDEGMKNITTVYLGEGIHFLQESHPDAIGAAISVWYQLLEED